MAWNFITERNKNTKDMVFKMLFGNKNIYSHIFPSVNDIYTSLVEATIENLKLELGN